MEDAGSGSDTDVDAGDPDLTCADGNADKFFVDHDLVTDILHNAQLRDAELHVSVHLELVDYEIVPRQPNAEKRQRLGAAYDGMRGRGCTTEALEFHHAFLQQESVTVATTNGCIQRDAAYLRQMWSHRCQFFLNLWRDSRFDLAFDFTREMIDSYCIHTDFQPFLLSLGDKHPLRARLRQLEETTPSSRANLKKLFKY